MGAAARLRRLLTEAALRNEGVRVGERELAGGVKLRGLYALRSFSPGDPVACYCGRLVEFGELGKLRGSDRALFDRITEYAVGSPEKGMIFPEDLDAPGAHLINHSCGPNTKWGSREKGETAMLVWAVKPIAAGDEITIDYGWLGVKAAYEKKRNPCACTARFCVGTIELRVEIIREGSEEGIWLDPVEVRKRFMADIANATKVHETLLVSYGKDAGKMVVGPDGSSGQMTVDLAAFFDKLRTGAGQAVGIMRRLQEDGLAFGPVSNARAREIVRDYELPEGGFPPERTGT